MKPKRVEKFVKITKLHLFTEKQMKKQFGLDGEITRISMYRGLSPNQEAEGVSTDTKLWEVVTESETNENRNSR